MHNIIFYAMSCDHSIVLCGHIMYVCTCSSSNTSLQGSNGDLSEEEQERLTLRYYEESTGVDASKVMTQS